MKEKTKIETVKYEEDDNKEFIRCYETVKNPSCEDGIDGTEDDKT